QEGVRQRGSERAFAGRLDTARHRPRAREEDEGVEGPDTQVQVRLGLQEATGARGPADDVDGEVGGEDEGLEENKDPHVRLPGNALGVCAGRHRAAFKDPEGAAAGTLEKTGSGPVPKSSRRIIRRSRVRKAIV